MALTLLASALLDGYADPSYALTIASPLAGVPYTFDAAFGLTTGDAAQVAQTALSCSGAVIDTSYSMTNYAGHGVNYSGRRGLDMGWAPDNYPVYLMDQFAALGLWRITFPTSGTYSLVLAGVGSVSVTVIGSAPVITSPKIVVLHPNPLDRQPSKLLRLTFTGTYPAGGLDLIESQIGLKGIIAANLEDNATYRFTWSAASGKLQAWTSSGEASGSVTLDTKSLFVGMVK